MMFISAPAEMAQVDHVSVDRLVAALVNEGVGDCARVRAFDATEGRTRLPWKSQSASCPRYVMCLRTCGIEVPPVSEATPAR